MTYTAYGADGGSMSTISASWNLETNKAALGDLVYFYALGLSGAHIESVPIPEALWLLGPGLVGLAAIRRRFKK
jgi:hypothetical protein